MAFAFTMHGLVFPTMLFAPNHSAAAQIVILKFLSLVSFSGKKAICVTKKQINSNYRGGSSSSSDLFCSTHNLCIAEARLGPDRISIIERFTKILKGYFR